MEQIHESVKKLEGLRDLGLIDDAEFDMRKKELIDNFVNPGASPLERLEPRAPIPSAPVQRAPPAKTALPVASYSGDDMSFVRVRGLPFECTDQDVIKFFAGYALDSAEPIHFQMNAEGRPTGVAFVKFINSQEASRALAKNRQYLGRRYLEVFLAPLNEVVQKMQPIVGAAWIRMRGIPFSTTNADIMRFFEGFPLTDRDIIIVVGRGGRHSGEAYVSFGDENTARLALAKDKQMMGPRYVELFISTQDECDAAIARALKDDAPPGRAAPPPYSMHGGYAPPAYAPYPPPMRGGGPPPGGDGFVIRMRGMPFNANESDVVNFFTGIQVCEINLVSTGGRPSGEAYVVFPDQASLDFAMSRNRQLIGPRYIELFVSSRAEMMRYMGGAPSMPYPAPGPTRGRGMPPPYGMPPYGY